MDTLLFWAGKFLGGLLLPPLGLLWLVLAGLLVIRRRPVAGRRLIGLGLAGFWLLATPKAANRLAALIEVPCVPVAAGAAEAIVILGGGLRRVAPEYGRGATLKSSPLERVRYAAKVYRETGAPILITGGAPQNNWDKEAAVMRDILLGEFGVPVAWLEDQSRTTRENAELSGRILQSAGIRRIYLISHAWHLRRAIPEFEQRGLTVVPAATACEAIQPLDWPDLIPDSRALSESCNSLHEWLGLAWYRLLRAIT